MFPSSRKVMAKGLSVSGNTFEIAALILALTGFLMVFLSVISNANVHLQSLYFLKISDPSDNTSITFGLYNYCITEGNSSTECYEDDSIMTVPYDINIVNMFNATYPELFTDSVAEDEGADPKPPHDPKIFVACVLCLLFSGVSIVLCFLKFIYRKKFQDEVYFNRGFLLAGSSACALLLIALCTVIYSNAANDLNSTYPHITADLGPCVPMIGVSFMVFLIATVLLLQGCWSDQGNKRQKYS